LHYLARCYGIGKPGKGKKEFMMRTFARVAIYMREGAKRIRRGVVTLLFIRTMEEL